jgi:hypothetical protein
MKRIVFLLSFFISLKALAQGRDERTVLSNVRALHQAVFATKDSMTLDRLFASELTYGHSGGKLENRQEALHNIVHNQSTYADLKLEGTVSVLMQNKTAVTRHLMSAIEKKKDGTSVPLKLNIMLVWVKDRKDWKLMARQAVKAP